VSNQPAHDQCQPESEFGSVERRDAHGIVRFPDPDSAHTYLSSLIRGAQLAQRLPELEGVFEAQIRQSICVATNS
jgi:hypothetical protein